MSTQKQKYDDFRRAANKRGQKKISFSLSSNLLELCTALSELLKNLSATLPENNNSTNHNQKTEMQTLSQSENLTFAKTKIFPSEEASKSISHSTTKKSLLHAESTLTTRKQTTLPNLY